MNLRQTSISSESPVIIRKDFINFKNKKSEPEKKLNENRHKIFELALLGSRVLRIRIRWVRKILAS